MVVAFFLVFFISFLRIQLYDYDFWWHLATGKYIVENGSLPHKDPFTYTTNNDNPLERKSVILKGNWLAESIFYMVFSEWDAKGIIILRSLLLVLFLFFIFLTVRKQNVSYLLALMITAGCFLAAKNYAGERPVLFTFFTSSVVFYLLEDFRINRSKKVFLIPALVMLLANTHPGYIVCIMIITLYLLGEGVRCFLSRDYKDRVFKGLLIIVVLTIIFSLFNPNGGAMLTRIFSIHGAHIQGIVEYRPTFYLYLNKIMPFNYSYITFLLFSLLSLLYMRRIGITHMLLLTVFTLMSFVAIRYVIFYMCFASPILARLIFNLREERIFKKLSEILRMREGFLYLIACLFGIFLVFNAPPALARFEFKANTAHYVPKGAADFLNNVEIKGNMFNEYGFGGYLIWRLYPDKKVFIDGRALEPDVYKEYQVVAYISKTPHQSWEDIMAKFMLWLNNYLTVKTGC
jgi:hypothetical protein